MKFQQVKVKLFLTINKIKENSSNFCTETIKFNLIFMYLWLLIKTLPFSLQVATVGCHCKQETITAKIQKS